MKRKVEHWEEYPLEDVPKLIYTSLKKIVNFVTGKITFYRERPGLLGMNIDSSFHKTKYKLQNYTDPPPPRDKKETDDDYYDRIDPKYGLRFYEAMVHMGVGIDLSTALTNVDEKYKDKKSREIVREFVIKFAEIEQKNKEQYQKYLIRSEILKNQS